MKMQPRIKAAVMMMAFVPCLAASAQNREQVKIKIDANVNGNSIAIDTTIDAMSDFDLHRFLSDIGLADEIGELNININDGTLPPHKYFDFDDSTLEEMKMQMQHFEVPPIPELPPLPGTANMMFFKGNTAFLGVVTEKVKGGVRITEVVENSAAAEAGLSVGDVITKIDAMTVESTNNLVEIIGEFDPGTEIEVTFLRNGETQSTKTVLKENKNYFESDEWEEYGKQWEDWGREFEMRWNDSTLDNIRETAFLGVYLGDADGGVFIKDVEQGSAAEEAGLQHGDIITALDGVATGSYNDIVGIIHAKKPGDTIEITYLRNGREYRVNAVLKSKKSEIFMWDNDAGFLQPLPPPYQGQIHTYAYCMGDSSGKQVNMQIRVIKSDSTATVEKNTGDAQPPEIIDPGAIQFYPNPNDGSFTLSFYLQQNGDTYISIQDMQGATVYMEELKGFEGSYEKVITLGDQAKGNYLINVTQNGFSATKQIVIQ